MLARELVIDKVGTAAASKDGSNLEILDSSIANVWNVGLMAYMKKPEYGGALIEARNIAYHGEAPSTVVQRGSNIVIDGETVSVQDIDVEELYKTIMKPGLR